ncbi:MAG: hypothetical protein PHX34_05655 [Candidatus Shapirobacteria bacterium]|nr:hypothetical protein [Candidatus Shapirobacteria bacterium]
MKDKRKDITNTVILLATVCFFIVKQYWQSFFCLVLLLILLRIDVLKKLIFKKGDMTIEADFDEIEGKIKENIKENNELVTKTTFKKFKTIEERVLGEIQQRIGGEFKKQIHFVYGDPKNPEFLYTPDAATQTDNELVFFEVKYISNPKLAKNIIRNTLNYLELVLTKFGPSAGKKLVIKLIIVSDHSINLSDFKTPRNLEIEFYKL